MVQVGLYSVGTHHKKFGWENKKIKMYFAECPEMTLGKVGFAECLLQTLDKPYFCFLHFGYQTFYGMFLHYVDLHVPFWDS